MIPAKMLTKIIKMEELQEHPWLAARKKNDEESSLYYEIYLGKEYRQYSCSLAIVVW